MAKKRKETFVKMPEPRYHVAVWDHEGHVAEVLFDASADEVDDLREKYADDPMYDVVAEER